MSFNIHAIICFALVLSIAVHNAYDLDNKWSHLYDKQLQTMNDNSHDFEETQDEINTAIKIAPLRYW